MVKAAIMGHGTVGSGVYEVFEMNAEKITRVLDVYKRQPIRRTTQWKPCCFIWHGVPDRRG